LIRSSRLREGESRVNWRAIQLAADVLTNSGGERPHL
jgi:hypothetical protein